MPDSIPRKQSWPPKSQVGPRRSRRLGNLKGIPSPRFPCPHPRPKFGVPISPLTRLGPASQALHLGACPQPSPLPFFRSGPSPQPPCPQTALPTPSLPHPGPFPRLPPTLSRPHLNGAGGLGDGPPPQPGCGSGGGGWLYLCLGVGAKGATGFGDVLAPADGGVVGVGSWAHIGRNGGGPYPQHPPHCRLSEGRGYCCRYLPHPSQRVLASGAGQEVGSMMGSGPRQSPLPRPASPPHAGQTSRWPRPGRAPPGSRPLPAPALGPALPAPVPPGPCSMSSASQASFTCSLTVAFL